MGTLVGTGDSGRARDADAPSSPAESGDERAVSHVVGVLLMIAITVLLISVVGVMALGFDAPADKAPRVASEGSFHLESDGSGAPTVALTHESGDIVDVSNVKVHITTESGTVVKDVPPTGDLADGYWSSGEKLEVPVETDDVCGGGDEADIRLVYHGEERTTTMAEKEVPLKASEFEISGGSVVPEHDYTAKVDLIATGYADMNVDVDPIVGGTVKSSVLDEANVDGMKSGDQYDWEVTRPAGTSVAVRADTSDSSALAPSELPVHSVDDRGQQVWALRDGDTPPAITGYGDQGSVEDYLNNHLDASGNIDIQDNQVIFLFELYTDGSSGNPNAYDKQDAVVLVTFFSSSGTPEVTHEDGEARFVCPA